MLVDDVLSDILNRGGDLVDTLGPKLPKDEPTIVIAAALGFMFADALQQFREAIGCLAPEETRRLIDAIVKAVIDKAYDDEREETLQ